MIEKKWGIRTTADFLLGCSIRHYVIMDTLLKRWR